MSTGYDSSPTEGDHRSQGAAPEAARKAVTLRTLAAMATEGKRFACLAAYDFTTARWLERAGLHLLLVGDSAANVILGFPSTIHMPLEFAITLTAAVKRGAPKTVVMADMPFMSYQASVEDAVRNAGRFMTEGLADIVKFEVDAAHADTIRQVVSAGIPVCAHIGTKPQSSAITAGPRASARTAEGAEALLRDALAMEDAGASMLLIEAVPPEVTEQIVARTTTPIIGIGAGLSCHGQILVVNDLLGLTDQPPRFAKPAASLGPMVQAAGRAWVDRVSSGNLGGSSYRIEEKELAAFQSQLAKFGIPANPHRASVLSETQPTGSPNS